MAAPWWTWIIGGVFWGAVLVAVWPYDLVGRLRQSVRAERPDDHYYP